jgi:hypothetical protein
MGHAARQCNGQHRTRQGEFSAPENRVGLKTYSKGPDCSSPGPCVWRVATFVALAIQLMALPSPVAHQSTNHRDILECSRRSSDSRLLLGT